MVRFHLIVWLPLGLLSCDKPAESKGHPGAPETTQRDTRPPRESAPKPRENLRAALKTAREIQSPEAREKAIAEIAWNTFELDPDLAEEAFGQLTADSAEKIRLIEHFAMRRAEQSPDEALAWAGTLGSEKEISAAQGRIALVIADTNPARAANLLSESGIEGRSFDVAVVQVLQRWAAQSPPDAAAWVVAFPAGKSREAGIKAVVSQWVSKDARAAFSWIGKLETEALHEEGAQAMAEVLAEQPNEVRAKWLQSADPEIRRVIDRKTKEADLDDPPP